MLNTFNGISGLFENKYTDNNTTCAINETNNIIDVSQNNTNNVGSLSFKKVTKLEVKPLSKLSFNNNLSAVKSLIKNECIKKIGDYLFKDNLKYFLMYAMKHNIKENGFKQKYQADYFKYMQSINLDDSSIMEPVNYLVLAIELNVGIQAIRTLLINGENPNINSKTFDITPLIQAIEKSDTQIVELLLDFKADPDLIGSITKPYTPLKTALYKPEIFQLLLENGIDRLYTYSSKRCIYT
jgi:ankyrin repeat protein